MLPSEDAAWVGAELTRRFGVPLWSFALTATDANRWALRLARLATGRSKVLAFSYCYHGSVDETVVVIGPDGETLPRPGNVGPQVDPAETTRVAEFNDLASVERALAHGDVAVVITEPALTNIGIVLPEPGFLEGVRELCTKYGALLLIDETHTFSAGPGGMTKANDLDPDIVVIGKSIAGGIPIGTYGISRQLADRINAHPEADLVDVGGVGGTLAGNALSMAAARATLGEVLTDQAFEGMIALATRFTEGVQSVLDGFDVPWSISQLGARAEYRFARPAPRNGTESNAAGDDELDEYMHLYTLNRGVLMTPFHNMALMCPSTSEADVDLHTEVFTKAVGELYA
jgi:glutamate-1-semialdehyde 2,1-aminomutase